MSLTSAVKKENNVYELEIAVGGEELRAAADQVFKRRAKDISVPGFRKGRAPRKIIEKIYGEGVFLQDAVDDLYPEAYSSAVEEANIEPVDKADLEILTLDKAEGFSFKATVTVKPEVTLKDYRGIEAVKYVYTATEDEADAEIERMRERNARIITVEDRAAQDGDTVVIDFEGFIDDVAFDGGKGESHQLVLGSHTFIEGFEEQIAGHDTGDEFDVNVTFPDVYHTEELAGKPAVFKVKLTEIKGKELPELDDEFVKDVSEFDTLGELKADVMKRLAESKEKRTNDELENKLIDSVIEKLEGDIPEVMFENRINEMVQDFDYRLQNQGMNIQVYLQYTGMDMEAFRKTFRVQAERQVKIRLALEKIAQLEAIEITEEETEKEYERLAGVYDVELDRVKAIFPVKDVVADAKSAKAIDFVRENAAITEAPAPEHDHGHDHEGHDHE